MAVFQVNLVYHVILGFSSSACSRTEFSRSTVTAFYWPDALPVTSSKNNAVKTLNEIQITDSQSVAWSLILSSRFTELPREEAFVPSRHLSDTQYPKNARTSFQKDL